MADRQLYRLKAGAKHLVPREAGSRVLRRLVPGSVIELTENQARSWADKFEKVETKADPDVAPQGGNDSEPEPQDTPPVPATDQPSEGDGQEAAPSTDEGREGEPTEAQEAGDPPTEPAPVEDDPATEPEGDPEGASEEADAPVDVTEYTVKELESFIMDDDDPWSAEEVEAIGRAEEAQPEPRKGVMEAVAKRIAQLNEAE